MRKEAAKQLDRQLARKAVAGNILPVLVGLLIVAWLVFWVTNVPVSHQIIEGRLVRWTVHQSDEGQKRGNCGGQNRRPASARWLAGWDVSRRALAVLCIDEADEIGHDAVEVEILGRIDLGDAQLLEHQHILRRDDAARHDRHVPQA